jgi:hypothetical protein
MKCPNLLSIWLSELILFTTYFASPSRIISYIQISLMNIITSRAAHASTVVRSMLKEVIVFRVANIFPSLSCLGGFPV